MVFTNIDRSAARLSLDVYDRHTFSQENIEGLLYEDMAGVINVAMRGTAKNSGETGSLFWDIMTDMRFIPRNDPNLGWVPAGFLRGARAICDNIEREITKTVRVRLSGHSLGGSISLLVGAMLVNRGYNIRSVRGFGVPHCGRLKVLDSVDVRCYRYANDFVATVPPSSPKHSPDIRIGRELGKWNSWLSDHAMANYHQFICNT